MDQLMLQAPSNISFEEAEIIFKKNNENIIDSLSELWDIKDNKKSIEKNKWDEIRETCDAFDNEMSIFMDNIRQRK